MEHGKVSKVSRDELTFDIANKYLKYDPITGIITARFKYSSRVRLDTPLGNVKSKGKYVRYEIRFLGTLYKVHQLAWLLYYGEYPRHQIDHIDRHGTNNAITNLRKTSFKENSRNRTKVSSNTSGHTGIWVRKYSSGNIRYVAEIRDTDSKKLTKTCTTLEDAILVRENWKKQFGYTSHHGS